MLLTFPFNLKETNLACISNGGERGADHHVLHYGNWRIGWRNRRMEIIETIGKIAIKAIKATK